MSEAYIQYIFRLPEGEKRDMLLAQLQVAGFQGFYETANELTGYATNDIHLPENFTRYQYTKELVKAKNWNEEWEKNFESVQIDNFVNIRANFHPPASGFQHEIIINPKMSFGTGHHATTYLMLQQMQQIDFADKQVLDFGTGTGILSIMAEKLGALRIIAIDNDEWSITNALENVAVNQCKNIEVSWANMLNVSAVFNIILANINKNVILKHLQSLRVALQKGGYLLLSGLLCDDENEIRGALIALNFGYIYKSVNNGWLCLMCRYL